jgi:hypothetical protein
MKDDDKREMVLTLLRWLRLPGMTRALDDLLARAANKNMTPLDLVAALADAEKTVCAARTGVATSLRTAHVRSHGRSIRVGAPSLRVAA